MIQKTVLLGPTASGKTELSIDLAIELNGEIISVDSRQCYKYLNIGTAKPDAHQLKKVKHYNVSVLEPDQKDSAEKFRKRSEKYVKEIGKKNKKPLFTGGSTLHLRSIIQPFDEVPGANKKNLEKLEKRLDEEGSDSLLRELQEVDPEYAEQVDGFNRQRVLRALDIYMQTGKPFSSFHSDGIVEPPEEMIVAGLYYPRDVLYDRINRRVDKMIDSGLVEETKNILEMGYSKDLQSLQTVGYRQVIEYLEGGLTHEQMVSNIKTKTRRYAKRQLTWFRRWPFIHWLNAHEMTNKQLAESVKQMVAGEWQKG